MKLHIQSLVEQLFCGNNQRVKVLGYFCRTAPSSMFDRILNETLSNDLLQLEEGLRRNFSLLGLHKRTMNCPCLLILLIHKKHKNNKMKSWTHPASSISWVTPGMKKRRTHLLGRKANTSNEQKITSNEQNVMSKKNRTRSKKYRATSKKFSLKNFQGNIWQGSFIVKEFPVSFIVKAWNFTKRNSSKDLIFQRQALPDVCKIGVLKDFTQFTGKYFHQVWYLMKLQAFSLHLLRVTTSDYSST